MSITKNILTVVFVGVVGAFASLGHVMAIAGGPTLELDTLTASVTTDEEFTVNVVMDTKTYSVSAADIYVDYPADKLQAVSIDAGEFLSTTLITGVIQNGSAYISVGSGIQAKQGSGVAATVVFRALQEGSHEITFGSQTQIAAAGEASDVTDTKTPITISVTGGAVTPLPTATPVVTATPAPTQATATPLVTQSASQVETGPGEVTVIALILASIAAVVYVGYTSTDWFRRREAGDIVDQTRSEKDRGDFNGS